MPKCLRKPLPSHLRGRFRALAAEREQSRMVQERLRLLIDQVKDYAIFMLDPQGRIATWNQGAERLKGYRAAEIIGRHFSCFYSPEDLAAGKPERELRQAELFDTYQDEGWRLRKDGSRFLANVVITALRDARGVLKGFSKVTRDITMQKDAEERMSAFARELEESVSATTRELQEKEARLEGFIRHATAAIAFKAADGRYLALNPRMATLLGRAQEEVLGRRDPDLLEPERAARVERVDQLVLASGQAREQEERWIHQDGGAHDYITQKFPLLDRDGRNWGLGVISTDITDRKLAEQAQLQSQKLESLGILSGGIAHDFNNLLGAILGNLGLAQMEISPSAPAHGRLQTIEGLVQKATSLTRQMLAYSGRGTSEVRPLSLNHLVEEMTHLLGISIPKKVEIRYDLNPSLPTIAADASQLQQVVMNLVINAADAIGDRPGTISLRTSAMSADQDYLRRTFQGQEMAVGTYVVLEVTDDGCGMSTETLLKIFDPFFTTKLSGRGLGLSAIQGIIRGHKGGIRVYSEPGRGTAFKLLFPATAAASEGAAPEVKVQAYRGSGTVLVVDDEPSIRIMASNILAQLGFEALQAADGMEALMLYETHKADIRLIILDLTMPHMDGAETCAALRARGYLTPIVLSSGFNETEAVTRFSSDGLAGFLQKPYRVSTFIQAVRDALDDRSA